MEKDNFVEKLEILKIVQITDKTKIGMEPYRLEMLLYNKLNDPPVLGRELLNYLSEMILDGFINIVEQKYSITKKGIQFILENTPD